MASGPRIGPRVGAFAVRLGVIAAIFVLAVLLEVAGSGPYSRSQLEALYALVLAAFLATLANAALVAYGGDASRQRLYELIGDGLLISALVYCSDGGRSVFAFLYNIWIVYAAVRVGARGALLTAGLSIGAFWFIAWGPITGWLPSFDRGARFGLDEVMIATSIHSAGYLFASALAYRLAHQIKRGREELAELGELHQRIFENVSSGLLTVDGGGRVTSFNREAARITGFSPDEVLGAGLDQVIPQMDAIPVQSPGPGGAAREELSFTNRAGDKLHLGFSSSLLRNAVGEPDGAILIFQDLTRVVAMEEQLRRSERLSAVGQLAAGLAHEIRNPLASLSGAIELLAGDLPAEDTSSRRLFRIVERETQRLDRLVSEFLSYARSGPGRREPVELRGLIEELAQLLSRGDHHAISVENALPRELLAEGDPDRVRQVFWNLLLNAAQAEPADGRVTISGGVCAGTDADDSSEIEVVVSDTGRGIPNDLLERVFEPFFTTKPRGTGLGLATVYKLVEAGGGQIGIESQVGAGTRVRVVLPRAAT